MSREFLVDEYGRVTCFYVRLGNRRFPVYQPGTIMFESSVQETGDLCVLKQGFQCNGTVLMITGALFLARFSASLALIYNDRVSKESLNPEEFHPGCFDEALTEALTQDAYENMLNYGRLLVLKSQLLEFKGAEGLSP